MFCKHASSELKIVQECLDKNQQVDLARPFL